MNTSVTLLAWLAAALAALPLGMALANLRSFFRVPTAPAPPGTRVAVLIPARDEAAQIEGAVRAALACDRSNSSSNSSSSSSGGNGGVAVEVLVFDDHSSDNTAGIVERVAAADPRVRLVRGTPLPPGWAGKQRACFTLAQHTDAPVLLFVDADVRLAPDAAARAAGHLLADRRLGMVSGFPRELTVTLGEQLVIPWIHVLLLGYLPMGRMRASASPAYAAACGQWVIARRDAYLAVGGHGAAPLSRHDGLSLPRTFRAAGWTTDVFDGTPLASCRMYSGFAQVWHGFGKSAGEGMATPVALPVWTTFLLLGHVLPWLLLALGLLAPDAFPAVVLPAVIGVVCNLVLRLVMARRLAQSRLSALLHPLGALLVLAINWTALLRHLRGRPSSWRGRDYVRQR